MNYSYSALVQMIRSNGLNLVDTSKLKHYNGEEVILPISQRVKRSAIS